MIKVIHQGYDSAWSNEQVQYIADTFSFVICDAGPTNAQRIRDAGFSGKLLYYQKLTGLHPADPDYTDALANGLIWHDDESNPVEHTTYGWHLLDIRKSGAWELILNKLEQRDYYDGYMLDDCCLPYMSSMTAEPDGYDEQEFYISLGVMLSHIRFAKPSKYIWINGHNRWARPQERNGPHLLLWADGISFEGFSYRYDDSYIGETALLESIADFVKVTQNKDAGLIDFTTSSDMQKRLFSLCLFLLLQNDHSYYYFIQADINPPLFNWPEYQVQIGTPTGDYTTEANGLLKRIYTGGTVYLNPSESTDKIITVPSNSRKMKFYNGGMWDDYGTTCLEPISGDVTIPAMSGLIVV